MFILCFLYFITTVLKLNTVKYCSNLVAASHGQKTKVGIQDVRLTTTRLS